MFKALQGLIASPFKKSVSDVSLKKPKDNQVVTDVKGIEKSNSVQVIVQKEKGMIIKEEEKIKKEEKMEKNEEEKKNDDDDFEDNKQIKRSQTEAKNFRIDLREMDRSMLIGRNRYAEVAKRRDTLTDQAAVSVKLGIMNYNGGNYEGCITNIKLGIQRGADEKGELWLMVARSFVALWSKTGSTTQLEMANTYFQKAVAYPQLSNNVEVLWEIAACHIKYGSYENALKLLSKILLDHPNHIILNKVIYLSAMAMKATNNYSQAGVYMAYLLDSPPSPWTTEDIYIAIARLYDQDSKRDLGNESWKQVWKGLKEKNKEGQYKNVKDMTSDYKWWIKLGESYESEGDLIFAADAFSVAVFLKAPTSLSFSLAKLYKRMNNVLQSIAFAKISKDLGNKDVTLRTFLRENGGDEWILILNKEEKASSKIGCCYRGHLERTRNKERKRVYVKASLVLQRLARGFLARCRVMYMKEKQLLMRATKFIAALTNKNTFTAFHGWKNYVLKNHEVKVFMRRILGDRLKNNFLRWKAFPQVVKTEKQQAATSIQAIIRGYLGRCHVKRKRLEIKCAIKLQALFRGRHNKLAFIVTRQRKLHAVGLIQRVYRGYRGRLLGKEKYIGRLCPRVQWRRKEAATMMYEGLDILIHRNRVSNQYREVNLQLRKGLVEPDFVPLFAGKIIVGDLGGGASENGFKAMAKSIQESNIAHSVWLYNGVLSLSGLSSILCALNSNSRMIGFGLGGSRLQDGGLKLLASYLKLSTLSFLHLENNALGDEGLTYLCEILPSMKNLQKLLLTGNKIGDSGAVQLGKVLHLCTKLTVLGLNTNKIGNTGVCEIAQGLRRGLGNEVEEGMDREEPKNMEGSCVVTTLLLKANKNIDEEGLSFLLNAVIHNKQISELDVSDNSVGDGVGKLVQNLVSSFNRPLFVVLCNNIIGDKGAVEVYTAIKHTGIQVQLDGNPISENILVKWDYENLFADKEKEKERLRTKEKERERKRKEKEDRERENNENRKKGRVKKPAEKKKAVVNIV